MFPEAHGDFFLSLGLQGNSKAEFKSSKVFIGLFFIFFLRKKPWPCLLLIFM